MTRRKIAWALGAAALAVGALPSAASAGRGERSDYDGRIVSVDRDARTFQVRDSERGTQRIRVTRGTRYERIGGFRSLRRGLLVEVDVRARRSGGAWLAIEVERSGRDDRGGRDDDSGRDDRGGRDDDSGRDDRGGGNDDSGRDDDRGRGRGRDD